MRGQTKYRPIPFSERIATLRELFTQPPSKLLWEELLAYLKTWPRKEQKDMGIDYVLTHIDTWDDELRLLPYIEETPYSCLAKGFQPTQKITTDKLERIFRESEWMQNYTTLDLQQIVVISSILPAISSSPYLSNVRHLSIKCRKSDVDDWIEFAKSDVANNLESLHLTNITEDELLSLVDFGTWSHLRRLSIKHTNIEDWQPFFSHPFLRRLESLTLNHCQLHLSEIELMIEHAPFEQLKELNLFGNMVCRKALLSLAECPKLYTLEHLNIGENPYRWVRDHKEQRANFQGYGLGYGICDFPTIRDKQGARYIFGGLFRWLDGSRPTFLKSLDISHKHLNMRILRAWDFSTLPGLRKLEHLSIAEAHTEPEGLKYLFGRRWPCLRSLDVSGMTYFQFDKKKFPALEELTFSTIYCYEHRLDLFEPFLLLLQSPNRPPLRHVKLMPGGKTLDKLKEIDLRDIRLTYIE